MIRYFCHTGRSDSFEYYLALRELDIPIRVIATDFANILSRSVWAPFAEDFTRPLTDPYINIVCGTRDELQRLWTAGVRNVAIPVDDIPETRVYDVVVREPPQKLIASIRKFL